jgi:hypothetical protein
MRRRGARLSGQLGGQACRCRWWLVAEQWMRRQGARLSGQLGSSKSRDKPKTTCVRKDCVRTCKELTCKQLKSSALAGTAVSFFFFFSRDSSLCTSCDSSIRTTEVGLAGQLRAADIDTLMLLAWHNYCLDQVIYQERLLHHTRFLSFLGNSS